MKKESIENPRETSGDSQHLNLLEQEINGANKDKKKVLEAIRYLEAVVNDDNKKIASILFDKYKNNEIPREELVFEIKSFRCDREKVEESIKIILNFKFNYNYDITKDFSIPFSFFNSELGRLVSEAYKMPNDILLSSGEVAILLNKSRQAIYNLALGQVKRAKFKPFASFSSEKNYFLFRLSDIWPYIE